MATNIFAITDTFTLLDAISKIEEPASYLVDNFFKEKVQVNTSYVAVEYRAEGRLLAPMLSHGFARGVDVNRTGSKISYYQPLLFGPRRITSLANVSSRLFGDTPSLFSPIPMEQQAARIQAEDIG